MEIIDDLDAFPRSLRGCVLTLGKYDGVHLGHQETLRRARDAAQRRGASLVVFTFSPSPAQILSPETASPPLVDEPTKRALLAAAGVDALVNFPTTREFLNLSAETFFDEIVSSRLGAVQMVEGADFSLGRGREGSGATLDALAKRYGVLLERVAPTTLDGTIVSSSAIRGALRRGDVRFASRLLGRPYRAAGRVARGDGKARTLGFPTANIVPPAIFLPAPGEYAVYATTEDGKRYKAAAHYGGSPSLGIETSKLEAHLLDFEGDLYGTRLELEFCRRLRETRSFGSISELRAQLAQDAARVAAELD